MASRKANVVDQISAVRGSLNGDKPAKVEKTITITPPKMEEVSVLITGTSPLVMNRFSQKAIEMMRAKQVAGSVGKKGQKREAKDFQACYEGAKHVSTEDWIGIPCTAFRNAMISACRLVGFKMTHGKLGIFVKADGYDAVDSTPLIRITKGEPRYVEHPVRNDSGVADIRARPLWEPGWQAVVTIRYDADMFTATDIYNLMARAGEQVAVLEGRADSKNSTGQGWGHFKVELGEAEIRASA